MEEDIIKVLEENSISHLSAKIATEIGMLYTERTNFREVEYLKKSQSYLEDYVKTFHRDSVDRVQLSHLISEIEEFLRNN